MWFNNSCVDVDMWSRSSRVEGDESRAGSEDLSRVKMGESIGGYVHSAPQCKHRVDEPLSERGSAMSSAGCGACDGIKMELPADSRYGIVLV
jgi:hypothetical protein